MMELAFTRTNGEVLEFVERTETRQLYRIRYDSEVSAFYSRPTALDGAPMVFRCHEHVSIPFTEAIQWWTYNVNARVDAEMAHDNFAGCFDTWATNDGKIRENRNYITGEMHSDEDPKLANLVCGGNVVMGREEELSERVGDLRAGTAVLRLTTLHPDELPSAATFAYHGNEHLLHVTSIVRQQDYYFGRNVCNPFPQMGGRAFDPHQPVYYGLMSRVAIYLPMWLLEKLPLGSAVPNPYNPAWYWD